MRHDSPENWNMKRALATLFLMLCVMQQSSAETIQQVIDVPTRAGVTQRILLLTPEHPRATLILFAGGHGGLAINDNGGFGWGEGNFLVRTRELFVKRNFVVAIIDKPSDKPSLSGERQTPDHVADMKAVIEWLRSKANLPVWLVGTSRGTQSAAYVASALAESPNGPDGIVLTSSILSGGGRPVPDIAIGQLKIPVLVVHHEQDGCKHCSYTEVPRLMDKLSSVTRKALITFTGGNNKGDPCDAWAYHGYNGLEDEVVGGITAWINEQKIAFRTAQ